MNRKILLLPILMILFSCGSTPSTSEIEITSNSSITTTTTQSITITTDEQFEDYLYSVSMVTACSADYFGIKSLETKIFETEESFNEFNSLIDSAIAESSYSMKVTEKFNKIVDFNSKKVAITPMYLMHQQAEFKRAGAIYNDNKIIQTIEYNISIPSVSQSSICFYYLIMDKTLNAEIETKTRRSISYDPNLTYKPIIYFYPEYEMDLSIKYINEDNLLTTYPKYDNGWNIHLNENGTFTTNENNREYYALYFDEIRNYECNFEEGFVVNKDNAINFLEEKLDYIGFTNREANEFMMYWLPILEQNENSLVYFEQTEERNIECPLEFSIEPETIIRTIIHIKQISEETSIKEQILKSYSRTGFTVTEWGGTTY